MNNRCTVISRDPVAGHDHVCIRIHTGKPGAVDHYCGTCGRLFANTDDVSDLYRSP